MYDGARQGQVLDRHARARRQVPPGSTRLPSRPWEMRAAHLRPEEEEEEEEEEEGDNK